MWKQRKNFWNVANFDEQPNQLNINPHDFTYPSKVSNTLYDSPLSKLDLFLPFYC